MCSAASASLPAGNKAQSTEATLALSQHIKNDSRSAASPSLLPHPPCRPYFAIPALSPSLTCSGEALNQQQDSEQGQFCDMSHPSPRGVNAAVSAAWEAKPAFFPFFFYFTLLEGRYKSPGYNLAGPALGSRPHRNPKLPSAAPCFLLPEYLEAASAYIY